MIVNGKATSIGPRWSRCCSLIPMGLQVQCRRVAASKVEITMVSVKKSPEARLAASAAVLSPTATRSIGASLAAVLRERIETGFYEPGVWIRESALAEEFGYSNGPIRDALQVLVGEGLLIKEAWRGVRVVELSDKEIIEIFQLRMTLLDLAAELACHHIGKDELRVGRALLKKVEAALVKGDIPAQQSLGNQLCHWLCDCSQNGRLGSSWDRLTSQSRMYIHVSLKANDDPAKILDPWQALLDALEDRDVVRARAAARHLSRRTLEGLGLNFGL